MQSLCAASLEMPLFRVFAITVTLLFCQMGEPFRPPRRTVGTSSGSFMTAQDLTFNMQGCIIDSRKFHTPEGKVSTLGMPRVIAGNEEQDWNMWFQYRDETIGKDVIQISSGKIGLLSSKDGIHNWELHPDSPVIRPSKEAGDWFYFDSQHVGLGDIVQAGSSTQSRFNTESNVYLMYTYGGNNEVLTMSEGTKKVIGGKMEIGVAVSMDGVHWSKVEGPSAYSSILESGRNPDDYDAMFVGWPSVLEVNGLYRMYFHTYNALLKKYIIAIATSKDGLRWTKEGPVFDGSNAEGAFDNKGASRRHILRTTKGLYHMYYEGISKEGIHSIGLALSKDGRVWERYCDKPVLEAAESPHCWDAGGVGSPHLVYLPESKRWRMYYVGYPLGSNSDGIGKVAWNGIGVAESVDEDGLSFERVSVSV